MGRFNDIDVQVNEVCELCGGRKYKPHRCKGCKIYISYPKKQVVIDGRSRKVEQVVAGGGYRK